MRFSRTAIVVAATLAVLLGACGGPTPAATTAPTAAAKTDAPFTTEWKALVAAAQKEGALTIVGGPEGSQQDGTWYEQFGKQYGIKVTLGGGNAAEVRTRTLAERAQGVYTIDVSAQGGTGTEGFVAAKILDPLAPFLIHPETKDRSTGWYVKEPIWSDPTREFCQYTGLEAPSNPGEFYYNSQKVSQTEIDSVKSWKDLLDPKWKGRIVIGDVASGEAATDRTRLWVMLGKTWFETLIRTQAPKIVAYGDERTYADGVARGDFQIALFPPGTASLQKAIDSKLPVVRLERTLVEGSPHNGAGRFCIMNKPPHPNAAKLFMNWVWMKDGQTALNGFTNREGRLALRSDVPQGKIKDIVIQRAKQQPFLFEDTSRPEWIAARADSQTYLKSLFVELKIVPGQ